MQETHVYSEGDWIAHSHYGIGQVQGIEVKEISGEENRYYSVKTKDNMYFWIPVDQIDGEVLRPLSTEQEIEQAIETLERPPKEMSSNYKTRQSRIRNTKLLNTPKAIARLIRDLRAHRRQKGVFNKTEHSAFRTLRQRLAEEWAIVTGLQKEKVESRLDTLLDVK